MASLRWKWVSGILVVILISLRGPGLVLSLGGKNAAHGVAVGALLLGFQVKLGLARGKYLPAGLHAVEASYVSASSISALKAAIVRSVSSDKMPLPNALVVLNLLDGRVVVGPAFDIMWTWFRTTRRCLVHRPEKILRVFHMLDLIARCADGHGLVHLLLVSAVEIGFAWHGEERLGFVLHSSRSGCSRGQPSISERYF